MNRIRSDAYKSAYDYATARAADDKNRQANAGTSYGGLKETRWHNNQTPITAHSTSRF
jgi:hypothetical protein